MTALQRRLGAIEAATPSAWQAWLDAPVEKWPRPAIEAFLAAQPAAVRAALKQMTNAELKQTITEAEGEHGV